MTFSSLSDSLPEIHEVMARNYLRQAQLLLDRDDDIDSAGALLYESAKQCINAVANQQGENPGPTGAKIRFLHAISERQLTTPDLLKNWQNATQLHIHADRGHLTRSAFMENWRAAQTFINQMLLIYADGG